MKCQQNRIELVTRTADDKMRKKLLKSARGSSRDSNSLCKISYYNDAKAFENLIISHQRELTKHCKLIKSYFEEDLKHDNTHSRSRKASGRSGH